MQSFITVIKDKRSNKHQVFEVTNKTFVNLKELQQPPSSDQLWYRKNESDGSFAIVSMSDGRALKCYLETSQVMLCDISEGDLWVMEDRNIVCKTTSQLMYFDDNNVLYCGDKMNKRKSVCEFQKVVCSCLHVAMVKNTYHCRHLVCLSLVSTVVLYDVIFHHFYLQCHIIIILDCHELCRKISCVVLTMTHKADSDKAST